MSAVTEVAYYEPSRRLMWTESVTGLLQMHRALLEAVANEELERVKALVNHDDGTINLKNAESLAVKMGHSEIALWLKVRIDEREARRWARAASNVRMMR